MEDIIVRTINLPLLIKGVTIPCNDGTYNIYINAAYSYDEQKEILNHELKHIKNFDFDNFEDIKFIEKRAKNKHTVKVDF